MTNAERLAAWRKAKGLSQESAADKIGVAQGTWSPWEKGTKVPGLTNALAIEKLTRGTVRARDWEHRKASPVSAVDVTTAAERVA